MGPIVLQLMKNCPPLMNSELLCYIQCCPSCNLSLCNRYQSTHPHARKVSHFHFNIITVFTLYLHPQFCEHSSCPQRGICDMFVYVLKFIKPIFKDVRTFVKNDYQLRHVCLSLRPANRTETHGSLRKGFHEILYLNVFSKVCREKLIFIKI